MALVPTVTSPRQLVSIVSLIGGLAWLAVGCGARTGLELPDAEPLNVEDAGVMDAAPDAPADAGVDAECIEVPFEGEPIEVALETEAEIGRADVVFLVDSTASMQAEIDTIRNRLENQLAPAIRDAIPDSQLGVATFQDFPVGPYGDRGDTPFQLITASTADVSQVQAGVAAIRTGDGMDPPESQVEALYQLATGEGIGGFVPPSPGCPSGGVGYACLRTDALPVVLLFTDAPFHNGPGGSNPYTGIVPSPHTYGQMTDELDRLGTRVIGFGSGGGDERADLREIALDTGAIDRTGRPLVFDIGTSGQRLGTEVVNAIRTFASDAVFDVDLLLVDPAPGDGVDVTGFVERVVPVRADPADGLGSIDEEAGVFREVSAGTLVVFELVIGNDAVVPGPEPQTFRLDVVFRADGLARIARTSVELTVPGEDGMGCEVPDGG
ncbi:MAG: vWA domain-containing protein [Myxococcota bacterium]